MYIYSRLSSSAVVEQLLPDYGLTSSVQCQYYVLGLHDNYIIEDGDRRYILRVYRNDWRSREDVLFETDLLTFLAAAGAPVAGPLPTIHGARCIFRDYPEGEKAVALFPYAPGVAPGNDLNVDQSRLLGEVVAQIHSEADRYVPRFSRQVLTIDYLLDTSVRVVSGFVDSDDAKYLNDQQVLIKVQLPELPTRPPYFGICHGDANPGNVHIDKNGNLTLFDFDQCGYGWRAFEIGKFMSSILGRPDRNQLVSHFVAGYQSVRRLTKDELKAIISFTKISFIWVLAIHAYNADRIGYKYLGREFWKKKLSVLKELDREISGNAINLTNEQSHH